MKKVLAIAAFAVAVAAGLWTARFAFRSGSAGVVRHFLRRSAPAATSQSSPDGLYKVSRVIDGDTIQLSGGERVRYIGIDTPETVDPRKPVQCFGIEASRKNKELVEGKIVRLEKDISERDKYGRLLRYVYLGSNFVNLELVKEGYASVFTLPPDVKYQNEFLKAESEAREKEKGLWGNCQNAEASGTNAN